MSTNPNNPNDVLESYPAATSGGGVAEYIVISGTGVVNTNTSGSDVVKASVSLLAGGTLQLTANIKDAFGLAVTGPVVNWLSYGVSPTSFASADPNGVTESYPSGQKVAGGCSVSATGLVTATLIGQYIVEARVVDGSNSAVSVDGSANTKSSVAYGQLVLTVGA